jgi:hypothetical protein
MPCECSAVNHLGKSRGLGRIFFVTQPAEIGDVEFLGNDGARIGSMLRLRTMAGFATDARVFSFAACFGLRVVTHQAVTFAGVVDGKCSNRFESPGSVVPVFSEGFRNKPICERPGRPRFQQAGLEWAEASVPHLERCSSSSLPARPFKRTSNRHLNASGVKHVQDGGQKIVRPKTRLRPEMSCLTNLRLGVKTPMTGVMTQPVVRASMCTKSHERRTAKIPHQLAGGLRVAVFRPGKS